MSGFLRRLVDRSLAPAALHPRASLGAAHAAVPDDGPRPDVPAEPPAESRAIPEPAQAGEVAAAAAAPPRLITAAQPRHDDRQPARQALAPEPAGSTPPPADLRPASREPEPAPTRSPQSTKLLHDDIAAPATASKASGAAQSGPAPLLPSVRPRQIQPPPPAAPLAAARRSDAAAGQAPDVHIHIGRIELSAPVAPGKAERAPRPAPAMSTLEDYLRGRRRERGI